MSIGISNLLIVSLVILAGILIVGVAIIWFRQITLVERIDRIEQGLDEVVRWIKGQ